MLSRHARKEWLTILIIGAMLTITVLIDGWQWLALATVPLTIALLLFFRDPDRSIPSPRGVMVAPADGTISSVHDVDNYEPLEESAVCIRIFLSVFNVHINRSPCHGVVRSLAHKPGKYMNALNPQSAEENESVLMVLEHPFNGRPVAAVRQVSGMLARTIANTTAVGDTLQRGQRIGLIKLGSTTELYIPKSMHPQVMVREGDKVKGAISILANVQPPRRDKATPEWVEGSDDADEKIETVDAEANGS
jgi:phosphatidylserine decarboxylase